MPPTNFDMDKVKTTLKQFVRDWSASGEQERRECYDPVLSEVKEIFKDRYTSYIALFYWKHKSCTPSRLNNLALVECS